MADEGEDDEQQQQFTLSEDLVQSPTHLAAGTDTIDFDGLLDPPLHIRIDVSRGNGGTTWPAGHVLAKYLLRKKRDVLENSATMLGAGSGLVGRHATAGNGNAVHITDQEPMLALMQDNIALNHGQGKAVASVYEWGDARPHDIPEHPDVVLAADCVYFEPAFPLLQQTLRDLIGPATICYFCFKRRRRADMHFLRRVKKDFLVEDVDDDPDRQAYASENIFLCVAHTSPKNSDVVTNSGTADVGIASCTIRRKALR